MIRGLGWDFKGGHDVFQNETHRIKKGNLFQLKVGHVLEIDFKGKRSSIASV